MKIQWYCFRKGALLQLAFSQIGIPQIAGKNKHTQDVGHNRFISFCVEVDVRIVLN